MAENNVQMTLVRDDGSSQDNIVLFLNGARFASVRKMERPDDAYEVLDTMLRAVRVPDGTPVTSGSDRLNTVFTVGKYANTKR